MPPFVNDNDVASDSGSEPMIDDNEVYEASDSEASVHELAVEESENESVSEAEPSSKRVHEDSSDVSESDDEETIAAAPLKKQKVVPAEAPAEATTLFIGNVAWSLEEDVIQDHFEEWLNDTDCISAVRIITDRVTKKRKGFGYIEFKSSAQAQRALKECAGKTMADREIRLDLSTPKAPDSDANVHKKAGRVEAPQSSVSDTLFLGNLAFGEEEELREKLDELFQQHGNVLKVRLPCDRETGKLKGFGYVQMGSLEESKSACEELNGHMFEGRSLRIDYAGERTEGGRGGRGGRGGDRGGRGRGDDRGGRGGRGDRGRGRGFSRGGRGGDRGGRGGSRGGFRGGDRGSSGRGAPRR